MPQLSFLDEPMLEAIHDPIPLVNALEEALQAAAITTPLRHHHHYGANNTLLMMPAWQDGRDMGVKLVTVTPENRQSGRPSIQGVVVYFNAQSGAPLALLDAATLTRKRTAAASALASRYLSRKNSDSLLLLGTGALAPELILAHTAMRPIQQVFVWGRSHDKAQALCEQFQGQQFSCEAVEHYRELAREVAIISTATMATQPLLTGHELAQGQHFDLVGSYKPNMREANDELIKGTRIFVDYPQGAMKESGDLCQPLASGVITEAAICGSLGQLAKGECSGRQTTTENTLFKSVGFALEDLVAARFYYERYLADLA